MRLSIKGCPEKKRFRPYVKRAALFYCDQLFSKKILESIHIQIIFNPSLEVYGFASIEGFNDNNKPREFLVELNPDIGAANILKTLAHELVHVKQYVYGETNETLTRWKGAKIDPDKVNYWDHPWEIEANGLESSLLAKFVIQEKLWEVFSNLRDPDGPIQKESLGFKEMA